MKKFIEKALESRATIGFLALTITLTSFAILNNVLAVWSVPTATPPGNNVPAPLNTSAVDQTKTGSLTVGGAGERIQAPSFIDNDNTSYFLDPNSTSKLSHATINNLNSLGYVNANINMVAQSYMQSPIFYDDNDINYYLDPHGTSKINAMEAMGSVKIHGKVNDYNIHTPSATLARNSNLDAETLNGYTASDLLAEGSGSYANKYGVNFVNIIGTKVCPAGFTKMWDGAIYGSHVAVVTQNPTTFDAIPGFIGNSNYSYGWVSNWCLGNGRSARDPMINGTMDNDYYVFFPYTIYQSASTDLIDCAVCEKI